ncbi:MAG: hypothetical protein UV67_C0010G0010 [Parcubacteria group bacterium GW2011_GWC1_43_12]|nr:MAG: hypothetical protein UV34_C0007G0002 [Parcubacteria group bacterium GW2011_GWB1_42_6]KKS92105.1 MAG: hypothetical protein UV67_C0010G0010 [Parcubacteria group bacterium GW2011_GWC1_43_12]
MMKKNIFILILGAIALVLTILAAIGPAKERVCFDKVCFKAELAASDYDRARGLMFRKKLPEDSGMLFIFKDEAARSFWMKDTLIPLDVIFIGADKKVVSVFSDVLPCENDPCPAINSGGGSKYVLEINAGLAQKYGIKEGDGVKFLIPNFSSFAPR